MGGGLLEREPYFKSYIFEEISHINFSNLAIASITKIEQNIGYVCLFLS